MFLQKDVQVNIALPMRTYINYAKDNSYKLLLVMKGFRSVNETLKQEAPTPYFIFKNEVYDVKFRGKYTQHFENKIQGKIREEKEKVYLGNIYIFENGAFKEIWRELPLD